MAFPVQAAATGFAFNNPCGPFQLGGNLYIVTGDPVAHNLIVLMSSDGGNTWSSQDAAHAPVLNGGGALPSAVTDGVSKIFVCYTDIVHANLNVLVVVFNATTNTWGTITITGNAADGTYILSRYRASDQKIVIATSVVAFQVAGLQRPGFFIFDANSFVSTAYTAFGNVGVNDGFDWITTGVIPGAGNQTHFIMLTSDPTAINPLMQLVQQSLSGGNALSAFQNIDTSSAVGNAALTQVREKSDGVNVVVAWAPSKLGSMRVYKGASAVPINFSSQTVNSFAAQTNAGSLDILTLSGTTTLFVMQSNGVDSFISTASDGGGGFGPASVLYGTTATGLSGHPAAFNLLANPLISSSYGITWGGSIFFAASAGVVLSPGSGGRGSFPSAPKLARALRATYGYPPGYLAFPPLIPNLLPRLLQRNQFDACLARDWTTINQRDPYAYTCPRPAQCYSYAPPWISMPASGVKFKPVGVLPVAGNFTGLDIPVVTLIVDKGYDGVISDLVSVITAIGPTGFAEGSGDISWRLFINRRPVRDLGNIQTSMGSMLSPGYSGLNRIRLFSGQTVTLFVNLSPAAIVRITPAARIICSLNGYFYPRT